jgi:hypothetical protein
VGALIEAGSSLTSSSNNPSTWTDNFLVNIWADESDLDLHGDTIDGAYYSVVAILGEAALEGVTATDGYNYGLFIITPEPVTVIDSTVTGTAPENTVEIADGRWGVEDSSGNVNYAGTAMYLVSDELTVSGGMATGYNNNGLLAAPYNEAGTALLSGLQLVNLGRKGAYIIASDTTAEGLVISGITEVEDTGDDRCLTVDAYGGFITIQANVQWDGGSITGVEGYGISGIASTLTVQNGTFSSNWCSALMNFQGALVASANTFSAPGVEQSGLSASVVNYLGSAPSVLSGNTFFDSATEYEDYQYYTYNDGTTDILYEWYYRFVGGFDVYNYGSEVDVIDNTFTNGTVSLSYYTASGTVSGNTWTNYGSTVLDLVDSTVTAEDLVVDGFAGTAISCSQGSVELDNVSISDGALYSYEYDFYYNGEFQYTSTSTSPGQGIATYDCSLTARDITMNSLPSNAWYAYSYGDNVFELDGWELSGINEDPSYAYYPAMYLILYSADTTISTTDTVYLTDISMTGIGSNSGINLSSPYYSTSALAVWAEDITIDAPPQYGLYLAGTSGNQNLTGSLTSVSVVDAGSTGVYLASADMDLDTVLVDGSGSEGLYLYQTLTNLRTLSSNSNATYGMSCVGTIVESCADIDLQGNGYGEMSGCSLPCATEVGDTGM